MTTRRTRSIRVLLLIFTFQLYISAKVDALNQSTHRRSRYSLLLTDETVLAQGMRATTGFGTGTWYRLTPSTAGSYVKRGDGISVQLIRHFLVATTSGPQQIPHLRRSRVRKQNSFKTAIQNSIQNRHLKVPYKTLLFCGRSGPRLHPRFEKIYAYEDYSQTLSLSIGSSIDCDVRTRVVQQQSDTGEYGSGGPVADATGGCSRPVAAGPCGGGEFGAGERDAGCAEPE